jgi:hypothetical protein
MTSLRYRLSERLLEAGATRALELRGIRRSMRAVAPRPDVANVHVVGALASAELVSAAAIWLGMLLAPADLPKYLAEVTPPATETARD